MFDYSSVSSNTPPVKVAIMGLGGAGNNILDLVNGNTTPSSSLYSVNLDLRTLNASKADHKIHLGGSVTYGLGSGGDPQVAIKAARDSEGEITKALEGTNLLVLIAGLGGGTGSGAAPAIAKTAKKLGAFVVSVMTMPFSFEGERRREQAEQARRELTAASDISLCFENDRIESLLGGEGKALDAFEASNRLLAQAAEAIPVLAVKPGIIHLGLDDLKSIVSKGTDHCLFGVGSAAGGNRAKEAAEKVLSCPLFAAKKPETIDEILIHVAGPESLTVSELEKAVTTITEQLPEKIQIHFGVSIVPELGDTLNVTAFAVDQSFEPAAPQKAEPEILPIPAAVDDDPLPPPTLDPVEEGMDDTDDIDADEEEESFEPEPESEPFPDDPDTEDEDEEEEQEGPVPHAYRREPSTAMSEFDFDVSQPGPEPVRETSEKPDWRERAASEPSFKGLFSDDNPFIVDGEDLDLPPSMRKKKD